MTVKVRPYRGDTTKKKWEVDIRFAWPDGTEYRERVKAPVPSKSGAASWGREREQVLLSTGKPTKRKEDLPTLETFKSRFIEQHCRAERLKPSTVQSHEDIFRCHLLPHLGSRRLDEIGNSEIQAIKARLAHRSAKTTNNVLTTLSVVLRKAVEWGVLPSMPCTIKLLKVSPGTRPFFDFDDYAQLVEAAGKIDTSHLVLVLLGGDAGLRRGEVMALPWVSVAHHRGALIVSVSRWKDHVTLPKSGRHREVPMTARLASALKGHRHLKGDTVLLRDDGKPIDRDWIANAMKRIEKRAGLPVTGKYHSLRHTFCSHLAMKGAPAKAIQELAGHADLSTTMRYMHLSPGVREEAIRLLEAPRGGEMMEKAAR